MVRLREFVIDAVKLAVEHYDDDAAVELVDSILEYFIERANPSVEQLFTVRRLLQLYTIALTYLRHEPDKMIALTEELLRLAERAVKPSPAVNLDDDWYRLAKRLARELELYAYKAIGGLK